MLFLEVLRCDKTRFGVLLKGKTFSDLVFVIIRCNTHFAATLGRDCIFYIDLKFMHLFVSFILSFRQNGQARYARTRVHILLINDLFDIARGNSLRIQ